MSSALAELKAKMAALEAEERALRNRLNVKDSKGSCSDEEILGLKAAKHDSPTLGPEQDPETPRSGSDESDLEDALNSLELEQLEWRSLYSPSPNREQGLQDMHHLPAEIIEQIIAYVSRGALAQSTLATCCLVSRQWYHAALPPLYRRPKLYGQNFEPFARAICPSINIHVRKSHVADLVRTLDMSRLVHQSSKSVTARLLGRTKDQLEEFYAPQASFSLHCFPALSKCTRLKVLDLSLVSESPALPELLKTISRLTDLRTLRLPRSAGFGAQKRSTFPEVTWPPRVSDLTLSGGIDAHFIRGIASFPQTLTHLTIEHCPMAKSYAITHLLKTAIAPLRNLTYFKLAHLPRISDGSLDEILFILPQITYLSICIEYITVGFFFEGCTHFGVKCTCPTLRHTRLRTLELTSPDSGQSWGTFTPHTLLDGISGDGVPALRQVRLAHSLGWHSGDGAELIEEATDMLQDCAEEDWFTRSWVFAGMSEAEYQKERCWEKVSGVWVFDD